MIRTKSMYLVNLLITAIESENHKLPIKIQQNIGSFKAVYPGVEQKLFATSEIREFILKHFDSDVLGAYDALKPNAFKCDLARHCIMYEVGGVYSDIGIYFLKPWGGNVCLGSGPDHAKLHIFRDFGRTAPWDVVCGLYSAPARHKAILKTIELICANVRNRYFGPTMLCPTGPTVFGRAIAMTCDPDELVVGDSGWLAPNQLPPGMLNGPSHCFVREKDVFAVRRKNGAGTLAEIGLFGGNDYRKLWLA
eukprot:gene26568-29133_t